VVELSGSCLRIREPFLHFFCAILHLLGGVIFAAPLRCNDLRSRIAPPVQTRDSPIQGSAIQEVRRTGLKIRAVGLPLSRDAPNPSLRFVKVGLTNLGDAGTLYPMKTFALITVLVSMNIMAARAASIHEIAVKDIDGKETSLKTYQGKVLLIVNVASKCGYTPQYEALQAISLKYKEKGFAVLGFPCNQFGHQEPGTNEEIKQFCSSKYNVTFPLFDKIEVNGPNRHPLYVALAGQDSPFPGDIKWNFNKFLIGRDGKIIKRFDSKATPDSPVVTAAIEAALAAK